LWWRLSAHLPGTDEPLCVTLRFALLPVIASSPRLIASAVQGGDGDAWPVVPANGLVLVVRLKTLVLVLGITYCLINRLS